MTVFPLFLAVMTPPFETLATFLLELVYFTLSVVVIGVTEAPMRTVWPFFSVSFLPQARLIFFARTFPDWTLTVSFSCFPLARVTLTVAFPVFFPAFKETEAAP